MDVGAALERVDQARVLGEVREHAQLDLRVVGGEQPAAVVGDERARASRGRSAVRTGMFCRFGASLEMRPVVVVESG